MQFMSPARVKQIIIQPRSLNWLGVFLPCQALAGWLGLIIFKGNN